MRYSHFIILCILVCGCKWNENKPSPTQVLNTVDTTFGLNASMFPVRNMVSSDIKTVLPYSNSYFLDTLKKSQYVLLDSLNIAKYVQPVITAYSIVPFARVKLISWQDKFGDLQPFIVRIDGQDYNGTVYILLNKVHKPVSKYLLGGGPYDVWDSAGYMWHTYTYSTINPPTISSYKLTMGCWHPDTIKRPYVIDSVVYLSTIGPEGLIETKRIDSTQYTRIECPKYYMED